MKTTGWITGLLAAGLLTTIAQAQVEIPQPPVEPARAIEESPTKASPKLRRACRADARKLCEGVEHDGILACLAEKKDDLGRRCLAALRRAKRVSLFRDACGSDVKQFCPEVKPGKGRILACLAESTVSEACEAELPKSKARSLVNDVASLADEAATEEQAAIEPVPEAVPEELAESPMEDPAATAAEASAPIGN